MKVGLLGRPGSGKTKIARRIARRLNQETKQWTVIDGYVDKLRARTGWPYGAQSNIRHNLQVLGERWLLEDEAAHKDQHTITCGTIYENIIYGAVESMGIPMLGDEQVMLAETQTAQTFMNMLGIVEQRYFDYDALFYLPLDHQGDHTWESVVDSKLPEVLDGFFRYAVPLTGTDKQKVDHATEIIRTIFATVHPDN